MSQITTLNRWHGQLADLLAAALDRLRGGRKASAARRTWLPELL